VPKTSEPGDLSTGIRALGEVVSRSGRQLRAAVVPQVADGEVYDLKGGLLGREFPPDRVTFRGREFTDSIRFVLQTVTGGHARRQRPPETPSQRMDYRAGLSMNVTGGQSPALASPVTSKPARS
jgi:hypothetical protein